EGNRLTREFCVAHGVPHRDCGKIVVASHDNEVATLERLAENGRVNGVENLRLIGPSEIREREPHVTGVAALEVPSTSIVSAEELVKAYARVAAERGANILVDARVVALEPSSDFIVVSSEIGDQTHPAAHPARADLVNALVYPLPHTDQLGLGVHLTRTLWDTVLVGPTARYVDEKNNY